MSLSKYLMPGLTVAALAGACIPPAAAAEQAGAGFHPITDWRPYRRGGPLPDTWKISEGVISHTPGGGDIVSVDVFANFELDFDWKISPGGNSGVLYRVSEAGGAPFDSGPEYQILDNGGEINGKNPLTAAASCYAVYAVSTDATKPVGEWNSARIIVNGKHVEHWLNGQKVVEYELGSDDWKNRVGASKFTTTPIYGTMPWGRIDLQDHGAAVWYRNMMIERLPAN